MTQPHSAIAAIFTIVLVPSLALLWPVSLYWYPHSVSSGEFGIVDLQLSLQNKQVGEILHSYKEADLLKHLSAHLAQDDTFIGVYLLLGALSISGLGLINCWLSESFLPFCIAKLGLVALLAGAGCDYFAENRNLSALVNWVNDASFSDLSKIPVDAAVLGGVGLLKFALLLVAIAIWCALLLLALRFAILRSLLASPVRTLRTAEELLRAELQHLTGQSPSEPTTKFQTIRQEVCITASPHDLVGLALSGGGIRTAVFALGLVSQLHKLGIVQHVDYLATVSGGGYFGGWWMRWKARLATAQNPIDKNFPSGSDACEPLRHFREFSNFLLPRRGLFQASTWSGVLAVLSGMIPALLIALSIVILLQGLWLVLVLSTSPLANVWLMTSTVALCTLTLLILSPHGVVGWETRKDRKFSHVVSYTVIGLVVLAIAVSGTVSLNTALNRLHTQNASHDQAAVEPWLATLGMTATSVHRAKSVSANLQASDLKMSLQIDREGDSDVAGWSLTFIPQLYLLGIVWLIAAAVVVFIRTVGVCLPLATAEIVIAEADRALRRLLTAALLWFAMAGIWNVAVFIGSPGTIATVTGALASASFFGWFRESLGQFFRTERPRGVTAMLLPYVPMVLAWLGVGLFCLGGAILLATIVKYGGPIWWLLIFSGVLFVLVGSLFFSPEQFGLHEFYRARIARAFLGASNTKSTDGRPQTEEQAGDDLEISKLAESRPLHLVCCAANDIAGDSLQNLSRGARSATVSRLGLMIGEHWATTPGLRMSSILTASAAAFNSQMGGYTMAFGSAVAFLLCALNLRLGLWLPHPGNEEQRPQLFPGWCRYLEMFNRTRADSGAHHVHLSDGGHFENLGLYELVRRRCRFIIVSDAGADPNVKLEDFGRALRRIREDFNVDIEVDLDPLLPDDKGYSRQHVAVGTIRYDANDQDFDVGVLVYFKPTLTGDEPVDLLNYKALNPDFPHETTGDQFYDEAQFESYRTLGSHAAYAVFNFLDGDELRENQRHRVAGVFATARTKWYPTSQTFRETLIGLNEKFLAVERKLAEEAPLALKVDIFPEYHKIEELANVPANPQQQANPQHAERQTLDLVIEMIQLLEEVWLTADLDRNYNHPLALSWMNAFNRWTRTRAVRRWWPFLIPQFNMGMRRFAERHLDVPRSWKLPNEAHPPFFKTRIREADSSNRDLWLAAGFKSAAATGIKFFLFEVCIPDADDNLAANWLIVGGLRTTLTPVPGQSNLNASWKAEDFVLRPGMWNSGLGGGFLHKIVKDWKLAELPLTEIVVTINLMDPLMHVGRGTGQRRERNDLVMFYKNRNFQVVQVSSTKVQLQLKK